MAVKKPCFMGTQIWKEITLETTDFRLSMWSTLVKLGTTRVLVLQWNGIFSWHSPCFALIILSCSAQTAKQGCMVEGQKLSWGVCWAKHCSTFSSSVFRQMLYGWPCRVYGVRIYVASFCVELFATRDVPKIFMETISNVVGIVLSIRFEKSTCLGS